MGQLVDARTWVVDNLVVNSQLTLTPGATTFGSVVEGAVTVTSLTSSGDITLANNKALLGTQTGATTTNLIKLDASNRIVIGAGGAAIELTGTVNTVTTLVL